jgi:hypothetical protein
MFPRHFLRLALPLNRGERGLDSLPVRGEPVQFLLHRPGLGSRGPQPTGRGLLVRFRPLKIAVYFVRFARQAGLEGDYTLPQRLNLSPQRGASDVLLLQFPQPRSNRFQPGALDTRRGEIDGRRKDGCQPIRWRRRCNLLAEQLRQLLINNAAITGVPLGFVSSLFQMPMNLPVFVALDLPLRFDRSNLSSYLGFCLLGVRLRR